MPDITIQINTPVLVAGESFKTRYRLLPSGAWSSYVTRTNAAFTLTGLAAGDYELEVIVVKNGTECPAIIRKFTVTPPFTCATYSAQIVQAANQFNLEITYSLPPGYVPPACGWRIEATGNTTNKKINYTTLPASPIKIPVANEGLLVRVIANLCNGVEQVCYEGDVLNISNPCVPFILTNVSVTYGGLVAGGKQRFHVKFDFTQSAPPTNYFVIGVHQINATLGQNTIVDYPSSNPYGPVANNATSLTIAIDANPYVFNDKTFEFDWFIMDKCYNAQFNTPGSPLTITIP